MNNPGISGIPGKTLYTGSGPGSCQSPWQIPGIGELIIIPEKHIQRIMIPTVGIPGMAFPYFYHRANRVMRVCPCAPSCRCRSFVWSNEQWSYCYYHPPGGWSFHALRETCDREAGRNGACRPVLYQPAW